MISIYDYTAKDIYTLFSNLYKEKHGISYKGAGFIGNEMHLIKVAIEENGSANIACATLNCIKANPKTVNVPFFIAGLRYYLTSYNPGVYWAIQRYGDTRIKKLWKKYIFLDSTWLPKASQRNQLKEIYKELKEWADAKTTSRSSKRKINPKK